MITTRTNHGAEIPLISNIDHHALAAKCALLVERSVLNRIESSRQVEWRSYDDEGKVYKFRFTAPVGFSAAAIRSEALRQFAERMIPELQAEFTT